MYIYYDYVNECIHLHVHVHVLMRDEKDERKKQARSKKQQDKAINTAHLKPGSQYDAGASVISGTSRWPTLE